jgi:hypothetical protein
VTTLSRIMNAWCECLNRHWRGPCELLYPDVLQPHRTILLMADPSIPPAATEDDSGEGSWDADSGLGSDSNSTTASLSSSILNYQYENGRRYCVIHTLYFELYLKCLKGTMHINRATTPFLTTSESKIDWTSVIISI